MGLREFKGIGEVYLFEFSFLSLGRDRMEVRKVGE